MSPVVNKLNMVLEIAQKYFEVNAYRLAAFSSSFSFESKKIHVYIMLTMVYLYVYIILAFAMKSIPKNDFTHEKP
jgi:hypothetical protein